MSRWKLVEGIDAWDGSVEVTVYRRNWLGLWSRVAAFEAKDEAETFIRKQSNPSYYDEAGEPTHGVM